MTVADLAQRRLDAKEADPAIPPEFSEDALADTFASEHGDTLRHVAAWGRWMRWDGCRWEHEATALAFDLARVICRRAAAEARRQDNGEKGERLARTLASAKVRAAVESLARADRAHAATVDQWDCDDDSINTPWGH